MTALSGMKGERLLYFGIFSFISVFRFDKALFILSKLYLALLELTRIYCTYNYLIITLNETSLDKFSFSKS